MKNIFFLASCFFLLASCSPQKRIARIAEKYNLTQTETVVVADTVALPGDTLWFTVPSERDTVIVTETATIETVRDGEIIHVKVTTPPDTIIKTVKVPVEKIVVQEKTRRVPWWMFVALLAAVAFATYAGGGRQR